LIDAFVEKGNCDGAVDYAQHIPVRIIAHMLGIPAADGDRFRGWVTMALQDGITNESVLKQAEGEITAYFTEQIRLRRDRPGDDLVSFLIRARQPNDGSGRPGRLVSEPELIPTAIEELLRADAPVTMAREIVDDVAVGGCPMKQGEMVLLSFPAANRDPDKFPDADHVIIDRKENPHVAFGLGIHRCIGSNLARMEMRVAVQEWLKRIPDFRLDPSRPMTWSQGTVRGPRLLPIAFG
jgi:hypothetical protein